MLWLLLIYNANLRKSLLVKNEFCIPKNYPNVKTVHIRIIQVLFVWRTLAYLVTCFDSNFVNLVWTLHAAFQAPLLSGRVNKDRQVSRQGILNS